MTRLNQIVAVEKGAKAHTETAVTRAYHLVQKPEPFAGLQRVYTPKDDEGESLPGERQLVTARVPEVIADFVGPMSKLFDVTSTKVEANTGARADVIVDGKTVLKAVPIELLLFLEKRLADCATFVSKLPILDPNSVWHWDTTASCWSTEPTITNRSKKVPKAFVKAPATDKFAAQVEVFTEDEIVGTWATTKLSGAVPIDTVREYARRIESLAAAVKMAREEANMVEVVDRKIAKPIFDLIFAPVS
jgi:hypothetical protein